MDDLGVCIRGAIDWSLSTRPNSDGAAPAFRPGGWADSPCDQVPEPLPHPSVSWRWQHTPGPG
ncbi:hypothetical protein [Streptomyces spectabilis]|uniref:Uncharacterized protein n=1 Tax=Streptomyces spectabilis TaxID=68270 RepID=A0A7W8ETQ3_STRST|nr:hypothetical protein [Streptomyces spectabilis]MBB5103393.1 hypothetical protein [Streptomyces spectabilis]MCI3902583.1 hypothetical protein [Streptomyces spectabilis]GGV48883.1 hypothetical protein GCM10010245_76930 [Streptomyces spectabilis]